MFIYQRVNGFATVANGIKYLPQISCCHMKAQSVETSQTISGPLNKFYPLVMANIAIENDHL